MQDTTLAALLSHPSVVSAHRCDLDYVIVFKAGDHHYSHLFKAATVQGVSAARVHIMIDNAIERFRHMGVTKEEAPAEILLELAMDKTLDPALRLQAATTLLRHCEAKMALGRE